MTDKSWTEKMADRLNTAAGVEVIKDFGSLASFNYGAVKRMQLTSFKAAITRLSGGVLFERLAKSTVKDLKDAYLLSLTVVYGNDGGRNLVGNCYLGRDLSPEPLRRLIDALKALEKKGTRQPLKRGLLHKIPDALLGGTLLAEHKNVSLAGSSGLPDLNIRLRRSKQQLVVDLEFTHHALQPGGREHSRWSMPWDVFLLLECCLDDWPEA